MNSDISDMPRSSPPSSHDELALVERLRAGDESAFELLVDQYYTAMLRLAQVYAADSAMAEEIVQETWLAVLRGLDRFQQRSSLKTWIFSILVNRARTHARREDRRQTETFDPADTGEFEAAVSEDRFKPADAERHPFHWLTFPSGWDEVPEDRLLSQETFAIIRGAIDRLPAAQRQVITLRDLEQWNAEEVCNVLELTETNQRVLLHRARSKVRAALENYLKE